MEDTVFTSGCKEKNININAECIDLKTNTCFLLLSYKLLSQLNMEEQYGVTNTGTDIE